jgi:hypothetical protein
MKSYENYPRSTVAVSNAQALLTYVLGAYIALFFGTLWAAAYLAFCAYLEYKLLSGGCTNCYYYGKTCAFGRGRLSAMLFKKGNAKKFNQRKFTWADLLPSLLVSIAPVLAGAYLLITSFRWDVLAATAALVLLFSAGNSYVRGSLACKFCKQRQLGCPAEKLFRQGRK